MLPVRAQVPAVKNVDEEGTARRKFELCKLDEDLNIDECEVIYDDDLVDVIGAERESPGAPTMISYLPCLEPTR